MKTETVVFSWDGKQYRARVFEGQLVILSHRKTELHDWRMRPPEAAKDLWEKYHGVKERLKKRIP